MPASPPPDGLRDHHDDHDGLDDEVDRAGSSRSTGHRHGPDVHSPGHDHTHDHTQDHTHDHLPADRSQHRRPGGHRHSGHHHDGHEHRGHHHGPGHDHDHDHPGGLRGLLTSLFAPHSHDPADAVDSALESSSEGIRAVKISLAVLLVTALAQAALVWWTGSVALLADTVHNLADALTAVPLWIAFALGRRAATRRYTYGFGRAEDLAGLFVVAMIALSAVVAGVESIRRLLDPQPVIAPWVVLAAGVLGFVGNEWVAVYRIRVGRRIGSAALVADGLHARTDGFTSLAVALGAVGVLLGFPLADPIVGLLITVAILAVLRGALLEVFRRLMDGVDPMLVDAASAAATAMDGVLAVRRLRMRWDGHRLTGEVEVVVDRSLSLVDARRLAHQVEHELVARVPRLSRVRVHAVPASVPASSVLASTTASAAAETVTDPPARLPPHHPVCARRRDTAAIGS